MMQRISGILMLCVNGEDPETCDPAPPRDAAEAALLAAAATKIKLCPQVAQSGLGISGKRRA